MAERKNEAKWIESRERWQINVQNDGKRRTFTSSTPGKKGKIEAEKKADKWLTENTQNENIRLEKLYSRFLEEVSRNKGTDTIKQHEKNGRLYILPIIGGHKKACKITQQNYQDCINAAYKKGLSKKTCQNIRGSLTVLYNYAKKNNIPLIKPEDIEIPTDASVKEKTILQPNQLKTVFTDSAIVKHGKETTFFYIHAIRLILVEGFRRGELCGLQKADIRDNILRINRSVNTYCEITPGKNKNAKRGIVLPEIAIDILKQQATMLKEHGIVSKWLFPDEEGNMLDPNKFYKQWILYRKQKGITCSIHELRHTMVSIQKNAMPEQLLKQIVGHSNSMDTFGIYGHAIDGEKEEAAKIINATIYNFIK